MNNYAQLTISLAIRTRKRQALFLATFGARLSSAIAHLSKEQVLQSKHNREIYLALVAPVHLSSSFLLLPLSPSFRSHLARLPLFQFLSVLFHSLNRRVSKLISFPFPPPHVNKAVKRWERRRRRRIGEREVIEELVSRPPEHTETSNREWKGESEELWEGYWVVGLAYSLTRAHTLEGNERAGKLSRRGRPRFRSVSREISVDHNVE